MDATKFNYSDPKFAIQNDNERYAWAAYHLFVFLSSTVGDTLILIASLNKDAFKINMFIITIIQHMAVTDLVTSLFDVFPVLTSLLANSWVLGPPSLCNYLSYVTWVTTLATIVFIAVLTTSKFLILKFPRLTTRWSTKLSHIICISVWLFCSTVPALMLVVDKDDVEFDYRAYSCVYQFRANIWKKIAPKVSVIFSLTLNIVIISTTIPTLKYLAAARNSARRVQGSIPRRAGFAVVLTASVCILSNLPYVGYVVTKYFFKEDPLARHHVHLYRVARAIMLLNTVSNFYIYFLTIKSFRCFVLSKVQSLILFFV